MSRSSVVLVTLVLAFVVAPSACYFHSATAAKPPRVVRPDVEFSVDCANQSYDFISGVASLGESAPEAGPNFVFTLGLSPFLYASSLFSSFPPVPLWSNSTASQASMGGQVRGAVMMGNSLFVMFSRDQVGPIASNILQIDDPWGTPAYQVHSLGNVVVHDVVTSRQAIYILARPKYTSEMYAEVLRFDMARSLLQGVRLFNVTGGKMALSADQKFLFVASTRPACSLTSWGCATLFNLDSVYLRTVWSQSMETGGCTVSALATTRDNYLYLADAGHFDCRTTRASGSFDSKRWTPDGSAQEGWNSVNWAAAASHDGTFMEGLGGVISLYPGSQSFVLQSSVALNFAGAMRITDISLGQHLVFTAPGCSGGILSAFAFRLDQFTV